MIWLWISIMVYIIFIGFKFNEYVQSKSFKSLRSSAVIFVILLLSFILYLAFGRIYGLSQLFGFLFCFSGIYAAFSIGKKAAETLNRGVVRTILFLGISIIVSIPFIFLQMYSIMHAKVNTYIRFETLDEFYDKKGVDYSHIYIPMSDNGWHIKSEYAETERTEYSLLIFPADDKGYDISKLFYSLNYEEEYGVDLFFQSEKSNKEQFLSHAEKMKHPLAIEQEWISDCCYYQWINSPDLEEEMWFLTQFYADNVYYNVRISVKNWNLAKEKFPNTYFEEELLKAYYSFAEK